MIAQTHLLGKKNLEDVDNIFYKYNVRHNQPRNWREIYCREGWRGPTNFKGGGGNNSKDLQNLSYTIA